MLPHDNPHRPPNPKQVWFLSVDDPDSAQAIQKDRADPTPSALIENGTAIPSRISPNRSRYAPSAPPGLAAPSTELDGLNKLVAGKEQTLAAVRSPRKDDGENGLSEK